MERPNTAIQLYTLRDWNASLPDVIRKVSSAGFDGVEFAHRTHDASPLEIRRALEETGTVPVGAHVDLSELETALEELIDHFGTIGCRRLVIPHIGARHFRTRDRVEAIVDRLHAVSDRLHDNGFELVYHNSREPMLPLLDPYGVDRLLEFDLPAGVWNHVSDGIGRVRRYDEADLSSRTGFGHLVATSDPDRLAFEIDVKWVVAAGYRPETAFELVGDRLQMVHLADVRLRRRFPPAFESVPPGEGMVDIDGSIAAATRAGAPWIVFEDDNPQDPETALEQGANTVRSIEQSAPIGH